MTSQKQSEQATRDSILKLLSDNEIAKVSTAETAASLADRDEYVDLEHIDRGVQRAHGANAGTAHTLPRRAVLESTWSKILAHLAAAGSPATHTAR